MTSGTTWRIRDFERTDQDTVRELVLQGLAERWGEAFRPDANPDLDDIWQNSVHRGAEVVVIEQGGALVATGTLIEIDATTGRLMRLSVGPNLRREGLGRTVVAELIVRSLRRGHTRLLASTDPPWVEAIGLYRSCGFELVEETTEAVHFSMELGTAGPRFESVRPDHPDAVGLMDELSAELAERYATVWPSDGRSNYRPDAFDPAADVCIVGYLAGVAVCCGAIRRFDDRTAEVKRMYVRPSARSTGLGRVVLAHLEDEARDRGYVGIVLETGSEQPEAIALYERAGYQPTEPWPPYDTRPYARCFSKRFDPPSTADKLPTVPPAGPHGGDAWHVARALGVAPESILDLSQNLNPFAPDVGALVSAHLDAIGRYPDHHDATDQLAAVLGVDSARVLLTNGGSEAIHLVASASGGRVRSEPEFALHPRNPAGPSWRSDPHSPSGRLAAPDEVADVWDEAFYPLATGRWTAARDGIVVGSLTKTFACPGLRLGYVVADETLIADLGDRQPQWSVGTLALAVLCDLLRFADLPCWSRSIAIARDELVSELEDRGFVVEAADAPWVLVEAPGLREQLAGHGVLVRDCVSFGLSDLVRIAVPDGDGLGRLTAALDRALPDGPDSLGRGTT